MVLKFTKRFLKSRQRNILDYESTTSLYYTIRIDLHGVKLIEFLLKRGEKNSKF